MKQTVGHLSCAPDAPVVPQLPACAMSRTATDHHRIEEADFEGSASPRGGSLHPQRDSPGHGLVLPPVNAAQCRTR